MDGPHRDAGAPTFAASRGGACDDAGLLRRIGQGDEDAMAALPRARPGCARAGSACKRELSGSQPGRLGVVWA